MDKKNRSIKIESVSDQNLFLMMFNKERGPEQSEMATIQEPDEEKN